MSHPSIGSNILVPSGAALEIAADAITVTSSIHTVDTEASAAADDLVTINVPADFAAGSQLWLRGLAAGQVSRIVHGVGNIRTATGAHAYIGITDNDWALFEYDGANLQLLYTNRAACGTRSIAIDVDDTPYTMTPYDDIVIVDTSAGAGAPADVQADLPAAAGVPFQTFRFKKISAANNMIITAAANIDGLASRSYGAQYSSIDVYSDGATYHVLG